jgi:hypothetical protein
VLQRAAVLISRSALHQVVDPDQDCHEVGRHSVEVVELVLDQVQRGEAVDGGIRELDLAAGLLFEALGDDRGPGARRG